jgi:hypothetical protein
MHHLHEQIPVALGPSDRMTHTDTRDSALSGGQTLPEVCLAQAALMGAWWWHYDDPQQVADLHDRWQRAREEAVWPADEPGGQAAAAYVLGAVLHTVAQETDVPAGTISALSYTRALPVLRDRAAVVRIVQDFVAPPTAADTGAFVKRLAIEPSFDVVRLWAEAICAVHAAHCMYREDGHDCTLRDRFAFLAPYAFSAA